MNSKKILLLGAGAVGVLPAAAFLTIPAVDFRVVADSDRIQRYTRDGIYLNGKLLPLRYMVSGSENFIADLVLIAVKGWSLEDALPLLRPHVDSHTVLLPLLNGINAPDVIRKQYPDSTILNGFFLGHASVRTGNSIMQDGVGTFFCGSEPADAEILAQMAKLCRTAGVNVDTPADFRSALWKKFILNVGINQTQAYYRAGYGIVQQSKEMMQFAVDLMKEAACVAEAEGITGTDEMIRSGVETIMSMPPEVQTSMLQDVLSGRLTEIDSFAGELLRRSKKHNIPVPLNEKVYNLING